MNAATQNRRTYATAQLIGDRTHQCDTTATSTDPSGACAYVLSDGIGSTPAVRRWTIATTRRLAELAARHGDAETALRAVYTNIALQRARRDPRTRDRMPAACTVVAVTAPGKPLTIAWCGDARAYLLTGGTAQRLTADHNLRRVLPPRDGRRGGNRNLVTSCLGAIETDEENHIQYGHPSIESVTRPAGDCRLLLASDGAYEPLEDSLRNLADYLVGAPGHAARDFVTAAVGHASGHADNATALVADLRP